MNDDDLTRTLRAAANELDVNDSPPMEAIAADRRKVMRRRGIVAAAAVALVVVVGLAVTAARSDRSANERIHTIGHGTVPGHLDLAPGTSKVRFAVRPGASLLEATTQHDAAGVWAYGRGSTGAASGPVWEVWHFDAATGRTKNWSLGAEGKSAGAMTIGFSACRDHVWLGAGDQLRSLDPATGKIATFTLPHVQTVGGATGPVTSVDSLACMHDGSLLVAPHLGTSLMKFDATTRKFSELPLPSQAFPAGAAQDTSKFFTVGMTADSSGHVAIRVGAYPVGDTDWLPGTGSEITPVFILDLPTGSVKDSGVSTTSWPVGTKNSIAVPTADGMTTLTFDADGTMHRKVEAWPAASLGFGLLAGVLPDGRAVLVDSPGGRIALVDPADGYRLRHVSVRDQECRWSSDLPISATPTYRSSDGRGHPATTQPAPTTTIPHLICQKPRTSSGRPGSLEGFMAIDVTSAIKGSVDDAGNVYYTRDQSPLVQQIGVPAR